MAENQAENARVGMAVLHGYDPETDKTTSDLFREDASTVDPYHRAERLRASVEDDFPGWIWSIGQNQRSRELMAAANLRRMGLDEWADALAGPPDPTNPVDLRVPSFNRVSHIDFDDEESDRG